MANSAYGGMSKMWLWRRVKNDPKFPKPRYFGRLQLYSVEELNNYDRSAILQKAAKPTRGSKAVAS